MRATWGSVGGAVRWAGWVKACPCWAVKEDVGQATMWAGNCEEAVGAFKGVMGRDGGRGGAVGESSNAFSGTQNVPRSRWGEVGAGNRMVVQESEGVGNLIRAERRVGERGGG